MDLSTNISSLSDLLADTKNALSKLEEVTAQGAAMAQGRKQAVFYRDEVMTAMKALRTPVDKLEMLVDKSMWPMPSYGASFAPSLWSFPTSAADSRKRSAWVSTAFKIQVSTKRN